MITEHYETYSDNIKPDLRAVQPTPQNHVL